VSILQVKMKFSDIAAEVFMQGGFYGESPQKTSKFHSHQYVECHLVFQGEMELETEEGDIRLTAGEMCILPKLFNHCIRRFSDGAQTYSFLFCFTQLKAEEKGLYQQLHESLEKKETVIYTLPGSFDEYCRQIKRSVGQESLADRLRLESLFTLFFLEMDEISRKCDKICPATEKKEAVSPIEKKEAVPAAEAVINAADQKEGMADSGYLWTIEAYIYRHYMEDITVADLAAHLHLSARQTERIVRKNAGQSFGELLLKQRMWAAKEFLRDSTVPIGEIPALVGFGSYSGFAASVKRFWGASPRVLRERGLRS